MHITLKLYAGLTEHLPTGTDKHAVQVNVPADATVNNVIDLFKVPRAMAHLVLLNGVYLHPEERDQYAKLKDSDVLAIWPPVAGG